MVTRRVDASSNSHSASPAMSNRSPSASMSTTSSTPILTPSPSTFAFGSQRASSPSFTFESRNGSNQIPSASNSMASETPRFTPSSTSSEPGEDYDPDRPLPSIERDTSSTGSPQSTPSTTAYTPSAPSYGRSTRQGSEQNSLHQNLQSLRLTSNEAPPRALQSQRLSTPSIQVSPTPPAAEPNTSRSSRRTDSLVDGIDALRIEPRNQSSRSDLLGTSSPSASRRGGSRSPTPSSGRPRSSSRTPHQIEDEDPPEALFHEIEVQQALANARSVASRMANALASSGLHRESGSRIGSLHQQAERLSAFQLPSSRIVGLVGDSGVGKSSLINSLLDKRDLARASNSGAACTCVVTEYHFHDRDDFVIHVDYFTLEELRTQFEYLLKAYRNHQAPPNDTPNEELEYLKQKADLASNTFRACFRDRLEQTPGILVTIPFAHALDTMVEWASQLLPPQSRADVTAQTQETFYTIEVCLARLQELTSEIEGGAGISLWPFIRKLRVYLKAHILSKGLIIADLPGLRDLNSARQNITERYVRECHQIFAVARIGRATSDQGVKDVFELAARASLKNVGLVCTRSDDIRPDEARTDFPTERARIEALQRKINDCLERIEDLTADIREYDGEDVELSEEETYEYSKLLLERSRTERSKQQYEFELTHHIVTVRNHQVSSKLLRDYRNHAVGTNLKIFCVSNTIYLDHRHKAASDALPYLRLSGIMGLRRHCVGIVADSHLRAATEYIKDEIPAFLGSVNLWVEAGSGSRSAERKEQILEAVSAVQRELDELTSPVSQITDISRTMNTNFKDFVYSYMRQQATRWSTAAKNASMGWENWHHSSYSAFCRQYGNHHTSTIGYRCWNEEAIATMKKDVFARWDDFHGDLQSYLDRVKEFVESILASVTARAHATGGSHSEARTSLRTLTATLRHRRGLLLYSIENAIEDFQSELSILRTDALSPIRTSIVGQLMERSYRAANMECGTGSHRRRKTHITNGFSSPTLFNDHRRQFERKFIEVSEKLENRVKEAIALQTTLIEEDLQVLRDENVVLESERNPEFRNRVAAETENVRGDMERICRMIDGVLNTAREDTEMAD